MCFASLPSDAGPLAEHVDVLILSTRIRTHDVDAAVEPLLEERQEMLDLLGCRFFGLC